MEAKSKRVAVVGVGESEMFDEGIRLKVTLPSGKLVTIRETNGDDEEVLSRIENADDGTSLYKYLANLVQVDNVQQTLADIKSWKVRDIYYAILKARMLSQGDIVGWAQTFPSKEELTYAEDLRIYDWDFSKEEMPPAFGEEGYDERLPQPYRTKGDFFQFKTTSGKTCQMKYLTGEDEISTLGMDTKKMSINDKMRIRKFSLLMEGGKLQEIENFRSLKSSEMKEIRKAIEVNDPEFNLYCKLISPGGSSVEISLLAVKDFFFPLV